MNPPEQKEEEEEEVPNQVEEVDIQQILSLNLETMNTITKLRDENIKIEKRINGN